MRIIEKKCLTPDEIMQAVYRLLRLTLRCFRTCCPKERDAIRILMRIFTRTITRETVTRTHVTHTGREIYNKRIKRERMLKKRSTSTREIVDSKQCLTTLFFYSLLFYFRQYSLGKEYSPYRLSFSFQQLLEDTLRINTRKYMNINILYIRVHELLVEQVGRIEEFPISIRLQLLVNVLSTVFYFSISSERTLPCFNLRTLHDEGRKAGNSKIIKSLSQVTARDTETVQSIIRTILADTSVRKIIHKTHEMKYILFK